VSGPGGIGGFFEETFAPFGLRKIQGEVLGKPKKKSWASKRRDIERPRIRRLAGLSSEATRDTATTASAYF